jgi:adenylate cyclase
MNSLVSKKLHKMDEIWEEERIFLFIALNNSTYLTQKLGNKLFSYLITQCVADIYPIIHQYKAQLYQIAGDEIVLSWARQDCRNTGDVLNLFFDFRDKLLLRTAAYKKDFGNMPIFTATSHLGKVAVSSNIFRADEPVYRGDVLKTCGGLLKLCTALDKPIIVTEDFINSLSKSHDFTIQPLGRYLIKGKPDHENVYGVQR